MTSGAEKVNIPKLGTAIPLPILSCLLIYNPIDNEINNE